MLKKDFAKTGKVCKTTFSLPKEAVVEAREVFLLGEFNNWDAEHPVVMQKQKDGSFATTLELDSNRDYQFRYLINREKWENDWAADDYIPVPAFGIYNSVVFTNYTNGKSNGTPAVAEAKSVMNPEVKKPEVKKAPAAAKTTESAKDDLKKIEGIGPKIEELLHKAGIFTFAGLATAKVDVLKSVLDNAGPRFKMHDPATWAEQARLAADGKWEVLAKLQDALKAGKK